MATFIIIRKTCLRVKDTEKIFLTLYILYIGIWEVR